MITLHGHTKHCHQGRNHTFKSIVTYPKPCNAAWGLLLLVTYSSALHMLRGSGFRPKNYCMRLLITLHDLQVAIALFRMCGAYSTPTHHLVIIPLTRFENDVHSCLEECEAIQVMDDAWSGIFEWNLDHTL